MNGCLMPLHIASVHLSRYSKHWEQAPRSAFLLGNQNATCAAELSRELQEIVCIYAFKTAILIIPIEFARRECVLFGLYARSALIMIPTISKVAVVMGIASQCQPC